MNTRKSASSSTRTRRLKQFGALGAVGLVVIGFALYWLLLRDTSALSVNTVEADTARQSAIDEAVANSGASTAPGDAVTDDSGQPVAPDASASPTESSGSSPPAATADDAKAGITEVDVGQPDAAASIGNSITATWTVDTSIGKFDNTCLTGACSSTFAGFRINEELAGFGAKTVVGRTPGVSGSMDVVGTQIVAANFVVDMTGLVTDQASRTSALKTRQGGLETNAFPEAIFVLAEPIELGEIPAEGTEVPVTVVGDLTVHGVTRSVSIPLTAEYQAGVIIVFGELKDIVLSDFEIPKPSAAVVLSVENIATMELQIFFRR